MSTEQQQVEVNPAQDPQTILKNEETGEEEECEPCKVGVILGISKYVCEQSVSGEEQKRECDDLYDKVVSGEIAVADFIAKVREKVTDPQDLKTLDSITDVARDFKMA